MNDTPIATITPKPRRKRTVKKPVADVVSVTDDHSPVARLALNYLFAVPVEVFHEYTIFFATESESDSQFDKDIKAVCGPIADNIRHKQTATDEELINLACCIAIIQGSRVAE